MNNEFISEHEFHENLLRSICFSSGVDDFISDILL